MKPFTIAFPLSVSAADAAKYLAEIRIDVAKKQLIVPGSPMFYTPVIQDRVPELEKIFEEHSSLTSEERTKIASHGSLFFLQFFAKNRDEFASFVAVAKKILEHGALGVYVENSGCAWSGKMFLELVSGDVPIEAFINVVETSDSLFTLGMEPFGFPDLCVSTKNVKFEPRTVLLSAADSLVSGDQDFASGARWKDDNGCEFVFRNEARTPFEKGTPEWNAEGYRRLVAR